MANIRKSYIIVDEQNRWQSTGYNATPEEITSDIIEIRNRLEADGETDVDLLLFEIVGQPISVKNRGL